MYDFRPSQLTTRNCHMRTSSDRHLHLALHSALITKGHEAAFATEPPRRRRRTSPAQLAGQGLKASPYRMLLVSREKLDQCTLVCPMYVVTIHLCTMVYKQTLSMPRQW